MKEELEFYERQRFNKWWNILIMLVANGIFIYGCITQLVMGKPWGNNPMSNLMLIVVTILLLLLTVSLFFSRLDTVINKEGVYIRMFPFQLKTRFIPWDYVLDAGVNKVRLNGHGIRYGFRTKTYTVSGNYVLELTLKNNRKIFIGTQKIEELADFLDKINAEREANRK